MFAQKNRLPRSQRLVSPLVYGHPYFTLKFVDNKKNYSRFAVVVSKKVAASAVVRNTLRRKMQHALWDAIPASLSYDVLVQVKQPFLQETSASLAEILRKVFQVEGK